MASTRYRSLDAPMGIRLSKESNQAILKIAEEEGASRNAIIRNAVNEYLKMRCQIKKGSEAA